MCLLDEYIKENCLSVESVKKYVDDYSIFTHYIGKELELGRVYSSPLRDSDEHPSFSLFEANGGSIIFKDHGTNIKGNVFTFLQYLFSENKNNLINFKDVLHQINSDFDLGLNGTPKTFKPKAKVIAKHIKKERPKIEIVSKEYYNQILDYFSIYDITSKTLQLYNTKNVRYIYYEYKVGKTIVYPKTLCIAYKIGKYYKLYMPFESKKNKFRTDFPTNYVEGFQQLKYKKPFVLITKAMKEVMFFREHFDIDSVAGKSENTMIPDFLMQKLFNKYENVLIWLDRDNGGKLATEEYIKKYSNLIAVNYPNFISDKDPTDRYENLKKLNKQNEAKQEIKDILWQYLK